MNMLFRSKQMGVAVVGSILLSVSPSLAQQVDDCGATLVPVQALIEPWEEHTRTFANGAVRITLLGYEDPGAGPLFVMVLSPSISISEGDLVIRECTLIRYDEFLGFADAEFAELDATYDPEQGLLFTVPVSIFDYQTEGYTWQNLKFSLNQATGQVKASLEVAE